MDIDVLVKQIPDLIAFKNKVEALMKGSDETVAKANAQLDELMLLKSQVQSFLPLVMEALPTIEKTVGDIDKVAGDVAKLRDELAPVIAWVAAQQKAAEKPAEQPHAAPEHEPPAEHSGSEQASA